jgi:predicted DNA-binding transcriptional regulator AlpA
VTNSIQQTTTQPRQLLNAAAASRFLGVSKNFLDKRRLRGDGPPFRRIGRRVFYWQNELEAWVDQFQHTSTSSSMSGTC